MSESTYPIIAVALLVLVLIAAFFWGRNKGKKTRAQQTAQQTAARQVTEPAVAQPDPFAEHHRPHWSPNAAHLGENPVDWAMLIGAPFALCRGAYNDVLLFQDANKERQILAEAWGVSNRQSMLRTLYDVHTSGHRFDFSYEVTRWSAMSNKEAREAENELTEDAEHSDECAEELWRFRRVRANDRGIRGVNFLAWDYVRLAMLARAGATAGYLSEAEATDILLMIAPDIRANYTSWEDLATSFHLGRWYWNSEGGEGEANLDAHDRSRQRVLLGDNGPWSFLPWNTDVPPSRLLLADAIHEETPLTAFNLRVAREASVVAVNDRIRERQNADN